MWKYLKLIALLAIIVLSGCYSPLKVDNRIPDIKIKQGFDIQYEVNSNEPNWADAVNVIEI